MWGGKDMKPGMAGRRGCGRMAAVLGVLVLALGSSCRRESAPPGKTESPSSREGTAANLTLTMIAPIFGQAEGNNPGAHAVFETSSGVTIVYYFRPSELTRFDQEIGPDLAPKIQELYKEFSGLDRVVFDVYLPGPEDKSWRSYVSFELTRRIVDETNWTDFLSEDFLKVVQNLKYIQGANS
jgi:hypothetical protein